MGKDEKTEMLGIGYLFFIRRWRSSFKTIPYGINVTLNPEPLNLYRNEH
jgi:hypothetical protein